jgi:hypothetical protein
MYMCFIPSGFRDGDISLWSSKIFYKKEILRTVSNTGIYCSSDKVRTVYLVQYFFENSTSTSMHFATRVRTWRVARLYIVQCTVQWISETIRNRTHVHTVLYIEWPTLWPSRILPFPPGRFCIYKDIGVYVFKRQVYHHHYANFLIPIATNSRGLTCSMNAGYVVGNERASSLFFRVIYLLYQYW